MRSDHFLPNLEHNSGSLCPPSSLRCFTFKVLFRSSCVVYPCDLTAELCCGGFGGYFVIGNTSNRSGLNKYYPIGRTLTEVLFWFEV